MRLRLSKPFCPHWASRPFLIYVSCFILHSTFTRTAEGNLINPTIKTAWPLKLLVAAKHILCLVQFCGQVGRKVEVVCKSAASEAFDFED